MIGGISLDSFSLFDEALNDIQKEETVMETPNILHESENRGDAVAVLSVHGSAQNLEEVQPVLHDGAYVGR